MMMLMMRFVSAPVQSVFFLTGSNATTDSASVTSSSSYDVLGSRDVQSEDGEAGRLTFTAGVQSYLACVAVGGYPPPEVRVHLGQVSQLVKETRKLGISYQLCLSAT